MDVQGYACVGEIKMSAIHVFFLECSEEFAEKNSTLYLHSSRTRMKCERCLLLALYVINDKVFFTPLFAFNIKFTLLQIFDTLKYLFRLHFSWVLKHFKQIFKYLILKFKLHADFVLYRSLVNHSFMSFWFSLKLLKGVIKYLLGDETFLTFLNFQI